MRSESLKRKKGYKEKRPKTNLYLKVSVNRFSTYYEKEVGLRSWDELDIILFSADAYIDHPAFGAAVIGRTLEKAGYKVAIVPQPDWHGDFRDFKNLDGHDSTLE